MFLITKSDGYDYYLLWLYRFFFFTSVLLRGLPISFQIVVEYRQVRVE